MTNRFTHRSVRQFLKVLKILLSLVLLILSVILLSQYIPYLGTNALH